MQIKVTHTAHAVKQYRGPRWVNRNNCQVRVIAGKVGRIPKRVNGSLHVTNDCIAVLVFVEPIIQMGDHGYHRDPHSRVELSTTSSAKRRECSPSSRESVISVARPLPVGT